MTILPISKIRTDGGTQPRAAIDFAAVDDYTEAMRDGVKFPPIVVFYDGTDYWLADGFHRCKAAFAADKDEIACDVHQGTQQDAQWFSFSANKSNGLRRTNEDKQRAVKAALTHPKSAGMSDNAIAKHIGVSHTLVGDWRKRVAPALADSASETGLRVHVSNTSRRECSDGRVMNTANIGKSRKTVPVVEVAPAVEEYATDETFEEPAIEVEHAPVAQPEEQPICVRTVAGSTPAGGSTLRHIAPPKPTPTVDRDAEAAALLRAIYALAEHSVPAADVVSRVPEAQTELLYQKARAAFEFIGFVFDAASRRQKGVA